LEFWLLEYTITWTFDILASMKTSSLYLICFASSDASEELHTLIGKLATFENIVASSTENIGIVRYKDQTHEVRFELINSSTTPFTGATVIRVDIEDGDILALSLCRSISQELQYKVFDVQGNYFFPKNSGLKDITEVSLNEKAMEIFTKKGFNPKYYVNNSESYVINPRTQKIELLNPYLFSFFMNFEVDNEYSPEFSYPVAANLEEFTLFYDEGLIPHNFYSYYKKSLKIINASDFDINHIDRKVFIHPFFFVLNTTKREYEPIAPLDSAIHTYADKVRKGETLDDCLVRITSQDLGYADNYVRAYITPLIEFDRDKEGLLTPRLYARIYLKEARVSEMQKNKFQRKWTSLGESFH
jgi:hypothetical protein